MSPGYVSWTGPVRRPKDRVYGQKSVIVNDRVWVSDRNGHFFVIVYSVVAEVKLPEGTTNAPALFVVRDRMLSRDCVIVCYPVSDRVVDSSNTL